VTRASSLSFVIAGEAKQSSCALPTLDCFVASLLAMTIVQAAGESRHSSALRRRNQAARGGAGIVKAASGSGPNRFGPAAPLVTYQINWTSRSAV
jgi:hypothetical protein